MNKKLMLNSICLQIIFNVLVFIRKKVIEVKPSIKVATCGICTAISVVLLFFGGVIYIFAYVVPIVLGLLMMMLKKTLKTSSAVSVYVATSILSFMIVPDKETVLLYIMFFGYYPIIKASLDKIKPKFLSVLVKILLFNVSLIAIELICVYVFGIPFFEDGAFSISLLILFVFLMNFLFVMYEYILKHSLVIYERKLEKRVLRILKGKR